MWEMPERSGRAMGEVLPERTDAYEGRRREWRGGSPPEARASPAAKLDELCWCCWYGFVMMGDLPRVEVGVLLDGLFEKDQR